MSWKDVFLDSGAAHINISQQSPQTFRAEVPPATSGSLGDLKIRLLCAHGLVPPKGASARAGVDQAETF